MGEVSGDDREPEALRRGRRQVGGAEADLSHQMADVDSGELWPLADARLT